METFAFCEQSQYIGWKVWQNECTAGEKGWFGFDFLKCGTVTLASLCQISYPSSPGAKTTGRVKNIKQGKQRWYFLHPFLQSPSLQSFATQGLPQHDLYLLVILHRWQCQNFVSSFSTRKIFIFTPHGGKEVPRLTLCHMDRHYFFFIPHLPPSSLLPPTFLLWRSHRAAKLLCLSGWCTPHLHHP